VNANLALLMVGAAVTVSCTSDGGPSGTTDTNHKAAEARAIANVGCIFEDQPFCSHMIDKRTVLTQFFHPDSEVISAEEKKRGQRLLTEEVVDAAGSIRQCRKSDDATVTLIAGMTIARNSYNLVATSPVSASSSCYITAGER